ncbi:MAG: histidine phosphatase family protein [Desulfofustis sp.]|nr:histidine phosphatase family protein [Desulfofustis sp.]NNK55920.1 histidine phosphatase family protein [Desulfofustis sp.]
MKYLYLIRHAKSSWSDPSLSDFDRPLNKRGKRDLPVMGQRMVAYEPKPELIISSPAKRALRTARGIGRALGFRKQEIVLNEELYTFSPEGFLEVIRGTPDVIQVLALVGHNHGLTECAEMLSGDSLGNVPTCGIVLISFNQPSWHMVVSGGGSLVLFDYPKRQQAKS